ncbi:MAG TPA: enoyl-CoA hydratase-related protein [Sphingopyxis sp.]|nr:enoyl-CoA hydratase-related protein [Sphingopyxis sp.]HMP46382.1 enoyl-CoA hydratase-related protein [Sphingopyxis sp.]HMQ17739.1 enoyl-CoA hydratase-related protein [Sphingopyxis sp.]
MTAADIETIDYIFVRLEFDGALAIVTLNDPDRLNAMGDDMATSLAAALAEIVKPRRRCRAVLLTGEGRAFCAGYNLMVNRQTIASGKSTILPLGGAETLYHPMLRRLHGLPIPLIAGVNGLAIGIGLGVALAADHIVMAEDAWFQTPFAKLASAPDSGLSWLLPRAIGVPRAKRMLMRAERIDAATALEWGLVGETVPTGQLRARALEVAREFAGGATIALGEIKALIADGLRQDLHSGFEAEARAVGRTARTKDNLAAVRVFASKEKPVFTGE